MPISPSARVPCPVIAITLGDPGGVGPEVTIKALSRLAKISLVRKASLVLLGPPTIYERWIRRIPSPVRLVKLPTWDRHRLEKGIFYVLDPGHGRPSFVTGKISKKNALLAFESLRTGASWASCGWVDALVTAPVHKAAMRLVDKKFIGHTEYLARVSQSRKVAMMFDGGKLKVTLATIHVPLGKVSRVLTTDGIKDKIALTHRFLKKFYGVSSPRIAVSALNPHGKEFGREEEAIILPAVRAMQRKGIKVSGPFPGDTVFHEAYHGRFDAVIAMYHDQGLAPLKTVAFEEAVNLTLGLPFIRTSPDHGTAFEIAGRNRANENSMLASLRLAIRISSRI